LNVFSPPAQGNKDIVQLQEDLINEKADYQQDPELKKQALIEIINDYNASLCRGRKNTGDI
jgi:type I restriction enzyme R subunit